MLTETELTPTQQKLFNLLSDGQRHHKNEMLELLDLTYDRSDKLNLVMHISKLRKKILGRGLKIAMESYKQRWYYILVRNLPSPNDG